LNVFIMTLAPERLQESWYSHTLLCAGNMYML
jgi:hypothetical protein